MEDFETKYVPKVFEDVCRQYLIRRNRKEPVTEQMIREEICQVEQTGLKCYKYGFFSRSGFACKETDNLSLVELRSLYES